MPADDGAAREADEAHDIPDPALAVRLHERLIAGEVPARGC